MCILLTSNTNTRQQKRFVDKYFRRHYSLVPNPRRGGVITGVAAS